MKISSYEPVSSQKYENGYRTKICNFTVVWAPKDKNQSFLGCRGATKLVLFQVKSSILCRKPTLDVHFNPFTTTIEEGWSGAVGRRRSCGLHDREWIICWTLNDRPEVISCLIFKNNTMSSSFRGKQDLSLAIYCFCLYAQKWRHNFCSSQIRRRLYNIFFSILEFCVCSCSWDFTINDWVQRPVVAGVAAVRLKNHLTTVLAAFHISGDNDAHKYTFALSSFFFFFFFFFLPVYILQGWPDS